MVDTINELSDLSRKLNEKSDKTNAIITKINSKLAALNFGLEVWYEQDIEGDNFRKVYPGQQGLLPRQKSVTYLGYCNVETGWQLATKVGQLIEDYDQDSRETFTELTEVDFKPLLKEAREVRVKALPLVPRLLDKVKQQAESLIESIEDAEKAADALTGGGPNTSSDRLELREFGRLRAEGLAGSGAIYQYTVKGLPLGQEASIANMRSPNAPLWQILRRKNGIQTNWSGAYETATHALAALQAQVDEGHLSLVGKESDYRIEEDGHIVVLLSERATQRGTGPKPAKGARLAFKTSHDVAQFVAASELEGFVFEDKEFLI